MAFKNLLSPNQATAGRFLKNKTGNSAYNSSHVLVTYETIDIPNSIGCIKVITDGTGLAGVYLPESVVINTIYSTAVTLYCDITTTFRLYIGGSGNNSAEFTVPQGFNTLKLINQTVVGASQMGVIITTAQARTFYYLQ